MGAWISYYRRPRGAIERAAKLRIGFNLARANAGRSAFACAAGAGELPIAVPPGGRGVVRRQFQRAYSCTGRSLARDQGTPPHPHRRADRLRQDARGLPRGDRRSGPARPRGRAHRRNARRLRLARSRRCRTTSTATSRRRSPASARNWGGAGFPTSKSAPGSEPATRPRPNATGCAAVRRIFS